MVICLGRGAYLHMAQLMRLPLTIFAPANSYWFYLPGFNFLVLVHLGNPGQNPESCKMVVVVVDQSQFAKGMNSSTLTTV